MNIYDDIINRLVGERYRIRGRLGAGNFGEVFKAEYEVFGIPLRTVALKLFTKEGLVTSENAEKVFKEALTLERLASQSRTRGEAVHLTMVYDIGVLKDYQYIPYVAMEFVDGGSLDDRLKAARRFPVAAVIRYTRAICAGLRLAHEANSPIVHRDLKPANVLITKNDFVKVSDFGLAIEAFNLEGRGGTISYTPPEFGDPGPVVPAHDIYSLGITMLEFLLGYNPLNRVVTRASSENLSSEERDRRLETAKEKLAKWEDPETGRSLVEMIPELEVNAKFRQVLGNCLALNSAGRYSDAGKLDMALEACQKTGSKDDDKVEELIVSVEQQVNSLLIRARRQLNRYQNPTEAENLFKQVLKLDSREPRAYFGLADVYKQQGQLNDACREQERGASIEDTQEGFLRLAELFELSGDNAGAKIHRRLAEAKPSRAKISRR